MSNVIRRPPAPDADRPRLTDLAGHVYVTLAAAETYARERRLRIEEARRELTEQLISYGRVHSEGPPIQVRAKSRTTQVDVSATVVREGALLVVLSAHARDY